MSGLRRLCKLYGSMQIQGVMWVWDYANDKPVKKSEMTHEQWCASERAKWEEVARALARERSK